MIEASADLVQVRATPTIGSMTKPRISIACQGGGSQTAFTAGVLKTLFDDDLHHRRDIVGLSGTSGGALNAALA